MNSFNLTEFQEFPAVVSRVKNASPPKGIHDGAKIGMLTIRGNPRFERFAAKDRPNGKFRWVVDVVCDCGTAKAMLCQSVVDSCGCLRGQRISKANTIHGQCETPLYGVWQGMMSRCTSKGHSKFYRYGGRGISICDEWLDFAAFAAFAIANGWREGLEIDRRENNGNYEPGNCRFITHKENNWNKSTSRIITAFGESKCVAAWADDPRCSVGAITIQSRLRYGWDDQRAVESPQLVRRLTKDDADSIRRLYASGIPAKTLAKQFAISVGYVFTILKGKAHKRSTAPFNREVSQCK